MAMASLVGSVARGSVARVGSVALVGVAAGEVDAAATASPDDDEEAAAGAVPVEGSLVADAVAREEGPVGEAATAAAPGTY